MEEWATFVHGTKFSRVCWLSNATDDRSIVATGSWDSTMGSGITQNVEATESHKGDVSDMKAFHGYGRTHPSLLVGSSEGLLQLYEVECADKVALHHRAQLPRERSAEIAFDINTTQSQCAVVGDDGSIVLVDLNTFTSERSADLSESCSLHRAAYQGDDRLYTVGANPSLKLWDIRMKGVVQLFTYPKESSIPSANYSVAPHPTDPHYVAVGAGNGMVRIWDERKPDSPVETPACDAAGAPSSSIIWHLMWYPGERDALLSAGEDGTLLLWNFNAVGDKHRTHFEPDNSDSNLFLKRLASQMLGINHFDLDKQNARRIFCASDSRSIQVLYLAEQFHLVAMEEEMEF